MRSVPDPAERGFHIRAALRADRRAGLGVDEALHADADPGRPAVGEDGEPVGRRGRRRGLHRQRYGAQVGTHPLLRDVAEPLQFGGGQKGGGAAAEGRRGEPHRRLVPQRVPDGGGLSVQRVEVAGRQLVGSADPGEEVAEAAAHLAERYVEIERQRVLALGCPQLAQRGPPGGVCVESPVRRLVRIGVDVALVRTDGGLTRQHAVAPGSRKKCAYGTVQTDSWPSR